MTTGWRHLLATTFSAVLLASACGSKPHVLFIVSDDLGWDDCGFRNPQIRTPIIDNMAAKGVVLEQYYVQPSCSPTRTSFLSGRYPLHTGVNNFVSAVCDVSDNCFRQLPAPWTLSLTRPVGPVDTTDSPNLELWVAIE